MIVRVAPGFELLRAAQSCYQCIVISFARLMLVTLAMLVGVSSVMAQHNATLDYRGRMEVDGKPFSGVGFFCFAVLDAKGVILWSSGEFPFMGRTNNPASAMRVNVQDGAYAVQLGKLAGVPPVDIALLRQSSAPKLRIFFNDGIRGWALAGEDVPLAGALGLNAVPAPAEANADNVDVSALLREVRELRAKVDRQNAAPAHRREPAPQIVTVSTANSPSLGNPDAPVVLVEFTDFQCPFCKRFHDGAMAELKKNFVETGKLRIVGRNLTLDFHTNAGPAAVAALCAHAQSQFWPMRGKLFGDITALSRSNYLRYASELKLDTAAFQACIDENRFAAQVAQDSKDAAAVGITGTPTFVLGKPNGDKVTGAIMVGAKPYAAFEAEIQKLLGTVK